MCLRCVSSNRMSESDDGEMEDGEENVVKVEEYFPNYRPIKNTNERFTMIAEENAKQALRDLNLIREREVQRLSRLYCAGSDSLMIQTDIVRRQRREVELNIDRYRSSFTEAKGDEQLLESEERIFQPTCSLQHSTKTKHIPQKSNHSETRYNQYSHHDWRETLLTRHPVEHDPHLRVSTALSFLDHSSPHELSTTTQLASVSPYSTRYLVVFFFVYPHIMQAEPQRSAYTKTTPIEWNIDEKRQSIENYVKDLGDASCSKSVSVNLPGTRTFITR